MIIEKPQFPKGASKWWALPRKQLNTEQLVAKRKFDAGYRRIKRATDAHFKEADRQAYLRCINRDRAKVSARNAAWTKANWPAVLESRRRPNYRIASILRSRICKAIKTQKAIKSQTMLSLLGCTLAELMVHLEQKFYGGMTWENYGPFWHIDHKRPCASFDMTDAGQQAECFHYSNLQPLLARENLQKGARLINYP